MYRDQKSSNRSEVELPGLSPSGTDPPGSSLPVPCTYLSSGHCRYPWCPPFFSWKSVVWWGWKVVLLRMDAEYQLLRIVCRESKALEWVPYAVIKQKWRGCPDVNAILHLANLAYLEVDGVGENSRFFPLPEAFTYVRQCRDSTRNLVVTIITLRLFPWPPCF